MAEHVAAQIGDDALAERGHEVVARGARQREHRHDRDHDGEIAVDQARALAREAEIDHAADRDRHRQRGERRDDERAERRGRPASDSARHRAGATAAAAACARARGGRRDGGRGRICGCSAAVLVRGVRRSTTFMRTLTSAQASARRQCPAERPGGNCLASAAQSAACGAADWSGLFRRGAVRYRAATFDDPIPCSRGPAPQRASHEARYPSGLSHRQGRHDRRHRVHHPHHLGQGRRHLAPRHRPEVASGLDRRPAAAARPRRAALALPEEVLRLPQERRESRLDATATRRVPHTKAGALEGPRFVAV